MGPSQVTKFTTQISDLIVRAKDYVSALFNHETLLNKNINNFPVSYSEWNIKVATVALFESAFLTFAENNLEGCPCWF
jgi:hypothetical protein